MGCCCRGFRADRKSWAVIDYATKYCLAAKLTPTGRGSDALGCLIAAVAHSQRVLDLDDLRDDRGELELLDETTGELIDIVPARSPSSPTTAAASAARPTRTSFTGVALRSEVDSAISVGVAGLRDAGYSRADIAGRLGISRQAAQQRWGR